ncbi:hypothetical protein FXF53_26835 [Micromonospora sp. WP24]|nr:hypothetical protein [Micromonospora sp. WP24]TYB94679.1 hypothetical protein FXF53_26835 [Micromonospora sp. WP24]
MSYPHPVPARRPTTVRLAMAALLLMAVVAVGYAVAGLLVVGGTADRFRTAATGTAASADQVGGTVALLQTTAVVSAVVSLLVGVLLAGLALGLGSGRAGARVAVWVVCGLGVLGGCCGLALLVGQRSVPVQPSADDPASTELLGLIADAYPGWWIPLGGGLSVGQTLGYLVVAALLALPAANAWFHRRPAPVAHPGFPTRPVPHPQQPQPIMPPPPVEDRQ